MTISSNAKKVIVLSVIVIISALLYQFLMVDMRFFDYAMRTRTPKLIAMLITAFCIGSASIVFQSIINNNIVTPCLLGMNALYILIHTMVVFALGATSILVTTKAISFTIDLVIMGIVAVIIYGALFKRTKGNVLYILLVGTVLATLFGSITDAVQRIMDPNEYETLLNALIASFSKVNSEIIVFTLIAIAVIIFVLRKDLALLNVITLGKNQAINLGVDYDRTIRRLLLGVTLFIAIATALVGPISFLGLITANLSRQLFRTYKHSYLMMGSVLVAMVILVAGQTVIERVFSYGTTIAVFINVGGGIYFLFLLLRNRSHA